MKKGWTNFFFFHKWRSHLIYILRTLQMHIPNWWRACIELSGKRQQPNIYITYLPTLTWVSTYDLQFRMGMPYNLSFRNKSTRGLIMGSAFYSRASHHEECSITTRGMCKCKASILQAYFLRTHCTGNQGIIHLKPVSVRTKKNQYLEYVIVTYNLDDCVIHVVRWAAYHALKHWALQL